MKVFMYVFCIAMWLLSLGCVLYSPNEFTVVGFMLCTVGVVRAFFEYGD